MIPLPSRAIRQHATPSRSVKSAATSPLSGPPLIPWAIPRTAAAANVRIVSVEVRKTIKAFSSRK
jgi:hypothetical protein